MLRKPVSYCELEYVSVYLTYPHFRTNYFLVVDTGGRLGEAQSAPWRKLASLLATNHIQVCNWSPDCPYPPETKGGKGIEGVHTRGLRGLVAQFIDKDMPIRFARIDDLNHRQGTCSNTRSF